MDIFKVINDFIVKYGKGILSFSALAALFWFTVPSLAKISAQMYYGKLLSPSKENAEMLALMGDHLGGSTAPFIGGLACILTFMAFWAQIRANDEVKLQFKIQQFESQFFEMVRLNRENVSEMKINGYTVHEQTSVATGAVEECMKTITTIPIERSIEGRKVFVSMVKELVAVFRFCELIDKKGGCDKKALYRFAYRVFFFGSSSDMLHEPDVEESLRNKVVKKLKEIRLEHKKSFGQRNEYPGSERTKIDLHIKYAPFTGHESRLGHYYRHLYSTVKFVVAHYERELFDYQQCREYLKILRGQMSNDEQLMLYYNFICGFGSEWEDGKNEFFSTYRMLHNLPVSRVKCVENPRIRFQEQINRIKKDTNGREEMFEWGDFEPNVSVETGK